MSLPINVNITTNNNIFINIINSNSNNEKIKTISHNINLKNPHETTSHDLKRKKTKVTSKKKNDLTDPMVCFKKSIKEADALYNQSKFKNAAVLYQNILDSPNSTYLQPASKNDILKYLHFCHLALLKNDSSESDQPSKWIFEAKKSLEIYLKRNLPLNDKKEVFGLFAGELFAHAVSMIIHNPALSFENLTVLLKADLEHKDLIDNFDEIIKDVVIYNMTACMDRQEVLEPGSSNDMRDKMKILIANSQIKQEMQEGVVKWLDTEWIRDATPTNQIRENKLPSHEEIALILLSLMGTDSEDSATELESSESEDSCYIVEQKCKVRPGLIACYDSSSENVLSINHNKRPLDVSMTSTKDKRKKA